MKYVSCRWLLEHRSRQGQCSRTQRSNFLEVGRNIMAQRTPLTGKLIVLKRQPFQLAESSQRFGDVSYTSSTAGTQKEKKLHDEGTLVLPRFWSKSWPTHLLVGFILKFDQGDIKHVYLVTHLSLIHI